MMIPQNFKSEAEINKVFREHLESLEISGLDFDAEAIGREWQIALDEFRGHSHPPQDTCPGYDGSVGDPDVPPSCQR